MLMPVLHAMIGNSVLGTVGAQVRGNNLRIEYLTHSQNQQAACWQPYLLLIQALDSEVPVVVRPPTGLCLEMHLLVKPELHAWDTFSGLVVDL